MQTRARVLLAAGVSALLSGCAVREAAPDPSGYTYSEPVPPLAQPAQDRPITRYADADRDGFVTRKEAEADENLARHFERYDVDDNDRLDRGEFARLEDESRERRATASGDPPPRAPEPSATAVPLKPRPGPDGADTLNRTGIDRHEPGE